MNRLDSANARAFSSAQAAWDNASPPDDENEDYTERMEAITYARNALDEAEAALDRSQWAIADMHMADAMSGLQVPT